MTEQASEQSVQFAVLATDVVICTIRDGELCVRIMPTRDDSPFKGMDALPGALIRPDEDAETTARRVVQDRALLNPETIYLEQLATFSKIHRDPRGRVVAVAYLGLVPWDALAAAQQEDRNGVRWIPLENIKHLAYDHDDILGTALSRLRMRVRYTTLISQFMPATFTLTDLERAYSTVLGSGLDKRNFRKKILKLHILKVLAGERTQGQFRPAQLYSFSSKAITEIQII